MPSAAIDSARRHDLDALRAAAMLLGIVLHAALAYTGGPWMVQDTRTSGIFHLLTSAVHGFRMPLFFLLSGFFTAMLWRRRGLKATLAHRFRRVFLPLMLGMVTVVPLMLWLGATAARSAMQRASAGPPSLWRACATGEAGQVRQFLEKGADLNAQDPALGMTPLSHAALHGRVEIVRLLLDGGADAQGRGRDGSTALHAAAFLGRAEIADALLKAGADIQARNERGETALDATLADWGLTRMIARLMKVQAAQEDVLSGRRQVRALLGAEPEAAETGQRPLLGLWLFATRMPVFSHLWFLWFLCWMAISFAPFAWLAGRLGWLPGPRRWMAPGWCWLWLLPLTLLPAWLMSRGMPRFGPETSSSLLPPLPLLAYYAVFFGFGALYFECGDDQGGLGRRWRWALPAALLVILPAGLALTYAGHSPGPLAVLLQVLYAWLMCCGLMGLFRTLVPQGRAWIRYLSDASYWMYLAHLPLVAAAQMWMREWPLPAWVKFILVCGGVFALLLVSYEYLVRHTWLGRLLNGPRPARGTAQA